MNKAIAGVLAMMFAISVYAQDRGSDTNASSDLPLTKQQKNEVKGIVASAKEVGSKLSWECKASESDMKIPGHIVVLDRLPDIKRKEIGLAGYTMSAHGEYGLAEAKRKDDEVGYVAHVRGTIDGRKFSKANEEVAPFGDGMFEISITDSLKSEPHLFVVFKLDGNGRLIPGSVDLRGNTQEKKYSHAVGREPIDWIVTHPFACRRLP